MFIRILCKYVCLNNPEGDTMQDLSKWDTANIRKKKGEVPPYQKAKTSDNGNDTFFICNTRPPAQNTNIGYIKTG